MSKSALCILLIVLTAAVLPAAQHNQDQQQNGQQNNGQMNQPQDQQIKQRQDQQRSQQQNQGQMGRDESGSYVIIDPESVMRFGFDYDGDNKVDAYEYIYGYDLMMISPRGKQQMQQQGRQGTQQQDTQQRRQHQDLTREQMLDMQRMRDMRSQPPARGMQQSWQDQPGRSWGEPFSQKSDGRGQVLNTLSGEIDDLKQVRLSGMSERHVIARVETDQGQIQAVDLGPRSQINPLELQTGDRIAIRGVQGSINRKKMLMAMQVKTDDQQVRINRPQGRQELRFAGKVQETTIRSVGQNRPNHLLALVELDNEEQVVVDLGSNSMLNQNEIDISRNDDIVFLARPARFAGKNLLSATQLSIEGQTYRVGPSSPPRGQSRQQNPYGQDSGM